jgi:hypothetical protein
MRSTTPCREALAARVSDLAGVTKRTMSTAMDAGSSLLDAYMGLLGTVMSSASGLRAARCAIPETECPPRCVCQIEWEARRGEGLRATIRVTNVGQQARPFTFQAGSFQGSSGDTGVVPTLSPAAATLKPNESVVVGVGLEVGESFQPGQDYDSEVLIRGAYEQCVTLKLHVQPARATHCEVRQGEIPTRIRAHHWYDHFQCEELCFEPVTQRPPGTDNPTHG